MNAENPFEWFNRMDKNKDGKLSYEEVPSPKFKDLDLDGDGFVTLDEYKQYLLKEALKSLDTDGDGKISQKEFEALYFNTEKYFNDRQTLSQPSDGITLSDSLRDKPDPLGFVFHKDFMNGNLDDYGNLLQGTEVTAIVQHNGMLFTSTGGNSRDLKNDTNYRGFAVFKKQSSQSKWVVDLDVGKTPFRISTMFSARFNIDKNGNQLQRTKEILLAGNWAGNKTVLIRNDMKGEWKTSPINTSDELKPGDGFTIRSFNNYRDKLSGIDLLFAGVHSSNQSDYGQWPSSIYSASYDSESDELKWNTDPELNGVGRIMKFAECNGELYAACGIKDSNQLSGGIFKRIDGKNPKWIQVYRWTEYNLQNYDDEDRIMRGLTAVPDPNNSGKEVLIAFRYYPFPLIERIDPQQNYKATVELNLEEYFGKKWHGKGLYSGPIRCAYNGFTKVKVTGSNEIVHIASLQIYHPNYPKIPYNGSYYLIRKNDGNYDFGNIYDTLNPVSLERRGLDATRYIIASPFPEEESTYYFGGYDGAFIDNGSAWIYKGVITNSTSVDEAIVNDENLIVYPNPANTTLFIQGQTENTSQYEIVNIFGQIVQSGIVGDGRIDISELPAGFYFIRFRTRVNQIINTKFIKE
jgi:hypothetical protein